MNRRMFLFSSVAGFTVVAGSGSLLRPGAGGKASAATFPLEKSDAQWEKELTPEQFAVLRQEATEIPGSSPMNHEKRNGTFACAGCDQAVYSSEKKFDSGTGWPSFWEALPGAVATRDDNSLFMARTEVHCSNCGGHLGHVFDDGPPPTGKRHCINGVAMKFEPAAA